MDDFDKRKFAILEEHSLLLSDDLRVARWLDWNCIRLRPAYLIQTRGVVPYFYQNGQQNEIRRILTHHGLREMEGRKDKETECYFIRVPEFPEG